MALAQMEWHQLTTSKGRAEDITFSDINNALVCTGGGEIYKTSDAGISWQTVYSVDSFYLRSIEFLDAQTAFCGSLDSVLLRSNDSGATWTSIIDRVPQTPYGICGMDAIDGVIHMVGNFDHDAYYIASDDAGATFSYTSLNTIADRLIDVYFTSKDTGFAVGSYNPDTSTIFRHAAILRTVDGGQSWSQHFLSTDTAPNTMSWKIFPRNDKLYVSYTTFSGLLYAYSDDRGATWTEISAKGPGAWIQGIGFQNDTLGFFGLHSSANTGSLFLEYNTNLDTAIGVPNTSLTSINRFHRISDKLMYGTGAGIWAYFDSTETSLSTPYTIPTSNGNKFSIDLYPNPLIGRDLTIRVKYPDKMRSRIELYNEAGRKVETIHFGYIDAGTTEFQLDMSSKPGGVYYLLQDSFFGPSMSKFVYSE